MAIKNSTGITPSPSVMGEALLRAGVTVPQATEEPPAPLAEATPAPAPEPLPPPPPVIPAAPVVQTPAVNNITKESQMSSTQTQTPNEVAAPVNLNAVWSRPMSRQPLAEQLAVYMKALTEAKDQGIPNEGVRKAIVFEALTSTVVPAIICSMASAKDGVTSVVAYQLIVEKAVEGTINDRQLNDNIGPITLKRTVADAADLNMWRQTEAIFHSRYGSGTQVHFAGSLVLPKILSETDLVGIRSVAFNAIQAILTVYEERSGTGVQWSVDRLTRNGKLSVNIDYAPGQLSTATGLPLHSTLHCTVKSIAPGATQNELVRAIADEITHVDGFIDLVWAPPAAPSYYGQPPKTQQWNPRYVINRIDTGLDAATLASTLLGLASATSVAVNYAWGGVFLPRFASVAMRSAVGKSKPDVELRDLGALGMEVDLYGKGLARTSVLSSKTTNEDMHALIRTTINPEVAITLKVDEVGDHSWLHDVFQAAAAGTPAAIQKIINAADELTGNQFSSRWDKNIAIVYDDKVREHSGYFESRVDGLKHDIAEFDYLAILNIFGDKDMEKVRKWQATYDATEISIARRQADRLAIIEEIVGQGNVVLTGSTNRYTFDARFLKVLADALAAAKADLRTNNPVVDFSGTAGRQQYNLAQVALSPATIQGLFTTGGNATNTPGGVMSAHQRTY